MVVFKLNYSFLEIDKIFLEVDRYCTRNSQCRSLAEKGFGHPL